MNQKIRLNDEICDILPMSGAIAALQAADTLDLEISSELGQMVSLLNEVESGLETRLNKIKRLHQSIKEKAKKKKELTAECGFQAARLFS